MSAASAAVFRIAFGAIALLGTLRYLARGWVGELLVDPPLHFPYPGLEWVRPWPGGWMYAHFALMALAALGILLGWRYRVSAAAYAVLFTWVELIDRTLYINHYYWVSLTAALIAFLPLHRMWSLDARAGRAGGPPGTVPAVVVWALRGQLAMVYLFAGLAKLSGDWLVHAQPLATWLPARQSLPLIGPLLTFPATAYAMSWAGALFDLTIVAWLLWRRSRPWAYAAVVVFHTLTWVLFPSIGLFPWLMIAGTLIFFPPAWPQRLRHRLPLREYRTTSVSPFISPLWGEYPVRRLGGGRGEEGARSGARPVEQGVSQGAHAPPPTDRLKAADRPPPPEGEDQEGRPVGAATDPAEAGREAPLRISRLALFALAGYFALMTVVPMRSLAGSGEVLWSGEGYQFSWRVMLTEKAGTVQFRVTDASGVTWVEPLPAGLTPRQAVVAATDPGMIRQAARWIAASHGGGVEVRADAFLSLNGRPRARLVDPGVDLSAPALPEGWILPPPH